MTTLLDEFKELIKRRDRYLKGYPEWEKLNEGCLRYAQACQSIHDKGNIDFEIAMELEAVVDEAKKEGTL